jgi:predicted Rossmann fold nucleotide-binding protein DprA/Smf involved in DNA uptake
MAERLAHDLAARGLTIISGMARGIDTAGHRGAIAAKGKTVAVFGTGIDVIYPKENSRLSEQILALGGALISEFPIGTSAAPQNFPIRNRIAAGSRFAYKAAFSISCKVTAVAASASVPGSVRVLFFDYGFGLRA